jgi:hypothetical protein
MAGPAAWISVMPTRRTPRRWAEKRVITPTAIAAFARLQRLPYGSDAWWAAHSELHSALHARPWEFPCVEDPRARNPYPPGSYAAKQWETQRAARPETVELWRALQAAAKAARASTSEQSKHAAEPTRSQRSLRNPGP